jgi:cytohesin
MLAKNPRLVFVRNDSGLSPLVAAIVKDRVDIAELLLQNKADVGERNEGGETPLHLVASKDQTEIAALLLAKGAKVNASDMFGYTPLYNAVSRNSKDMVRLFLTNGARLHSRKVPFFDLVATAAAHDQEDIVRLLLEKGSRLASSDELAGALEAVSLRGRPRLARLLLENGASLNGSNGNMGPLHLAVTRGNTNLARFLLGAGAKQDVFVASILGDTNRVLDLLRTNPKLVHARDERGWTPLHWAAFQNQLPVAALLLTNGANVNVRTSYSGSIQTGDGFDAPLHFAVMEGHDQMVELLLGNGADINARGENGETPLYVAIGHYCTNTAKLLLNRGAALNATTTPGDSALCEAARTGNRKMAELLITNGADVNPGCPLFSALRHGDPAVAELLIAHGANVKGTRRGDTLLRAALRGNHKDLASLISNAGAEPDFFSTCALGSTNDITAFLKSDPKWLHEADTNRWTGLHYAANAGNGPAVDFLVSRGAAVENPQRWPGDHNHDSALNLAVANGFADIVELLLERGADVEARQDMWSHTEKSYGWGWDAMSLTPLQMAVERDETNIVEILLKHNAKVNSIRGSLQGGGSSSLRRSREFGMPRPLQPYCITAVQFAVWTENRPLIEQLLKYGANLNKPGCEALDWPIRTGNIEMVEYLIAKGADPSATTPSLQRTHLHNAVIAGQKNMAERLLQCGVDLDAKDRFGQTATHLAVLTEREDIADLLREHGAKELP